MKPCQDTHILHEGKQEMQVLTEDRETESVADPQPIAVSVNKAAALTDTSPYTWRAWIRDGKVHATRLGRRVVIPMAEVRRVVREGISARPHTASTEGN